MTSILKRFLGDKDGVAAVEFGLILPVLGAMFIGVADGSAVLTNYNQMRTAVSSGAQYIMSGGQDLTTAQNIVVSAWKSPPANAVVSATKVCKCGGVAAPCNSLCPDQTVPLAYISMVSSANVSGAVVNVPISTTETVRVR